MMKGKKELGNSRRSPLLIYTISYLSGILAGSRIFLMQECLLIFFSATCILVLSLYYHTYCMRRSATSEIILSLLLPLIFFLSGWLNIQHSDELQRSKDNSLLTGKGYMFADCILSEKPVRVKNSYRVDATVAVLNEKTILYLDKRFDISAAEAGDTLRVVMKPIEIKNFDSGFDYAGMLEKEGIYSSSFIRYDKIDLRKCQKPSFRFRVIRLKNKYVDFIRNKTEDEHLSGILIAITTGDKRYLERETRNAFSVSGTMHVLAVSGLHTAFLFSFL
ncbi:MAG: competence protein ComEC family protein, partial [Bacteroidales bacterium]|nr:competence protein ComEC family protein [Bacteroidales bacterium]